MKIELPSNPYKYFILLGAILFFISLISLSRILPPTNNFDKRDLIFPIVLLIISLIFLIIGWMRLKGEHELDIKKKEKEIELLEKECKEKDVSIEFLISKLAEKEHPFDTPKTIMDEFRRARVKSRLPK